MGSSVQTPGSFWLTKRPWFAGPDAQNNFNQGFIGSNQIDPFEFTLTSPTTLTILGLTAGSSLTLTGGKTPSRTISRSPNRLLLRPLPARCWSADTALATEIRPNDRPRRCGSFRAVCSAAPHSRFGERQHDLIRCAQSVRNRPVLTILAAHEKTPLSDILRERRLYLFN